MQIFPLQVSTMNLMEDQDELKRRSVADRAHCGLLPSQEMDSRSRRRISKPGDGHGELRMESTRLLISRYIYQLTTWVVKLNHDI